MFDFPASPTDGQTSNGYTYSAASQCWLGGPAGGSGGGASISVSDTPPAGPLDNQMWFESDTGITWIYYNDGNTKQWVAMTDAGGAYLPLTGGTLSGDLSISKDRPTIWLDRTTALTASAAVIGRMNGLGRWSVNLGATSTETGNNVGSNFAINRYNDAGTVIDAPIAIDRATGVVTATGLPPAPTAAVAIGQFKSQQTGVNSPFIMPAGGTWAWSAFSFNATTFVITLSPGAGVAAGGATVLSGVANSLTAGWVWRIA